MSLKGDLAESWTSTPDARVWTFKLRQGVKWHNVAPLNGREFVAADVKYCLEAYAKEGAQSFTFQEVEGIETPDKHTVRIHLKTPNVLFPQNVAEPITVMFSREVLEEDGDLKKRMIGTGPFILKEHNRKVRVVLTRNPDYWDKGRPYVDEYVILSTPDAATRMAAFRTGQSDFIWLASPSEVETHPQDERQRAGALVPQHADAVRDRGGPGQAALQRRARAPRGLDGDRPAEAGGHHLRGARHPRLGRPLHLLPGQAAHRGRASARGGSTAPRRPRSSWPRPGTRTASRPPCSTTSTSRR